MIEIKEIWLNSDFNSETALKTRLMLLQAKSEYPVDKPIVLNINSYGGSVDALTVLVDTILEIKQTHKLYTVCMGKAMSCGAVLLSYGDMRFVAPNSRVLIHQVSAGSIGTTKEMKNSLEEIERLNELLIEMLAKNTKKNKKQIKAIFDTNLDKILTPSEAVKFGIADFVGIPQIVETIQYRIEVVKG